MKKIFIILTIWCICYLTYAQNRVIDPDNPIAKIDIGYSDQNGNIQLFLFLNTIETTQEIDSNAEFSFVFEAQITGIIDWQVQSEDAKIRLAKGRFENDSQTPFKYVVNITDGNGKLVMSPNDVRDWVRISDLKISYKLNENFGQLPAFTIYPPIIRDEPIPTPKLEITQVRKTGDREGVIAVSSGKSGTAFKVTSLLIKKKGRDGQISSMILDEQSLGSNRYANNGSIEVPFNTSFDIEINSSLITYEASVLAVKINDINQAMSSETINIVFIESLPPRIINRPSGYSLVIEDQNVIQDARIRMVGNGELGIEFLSTEYKNKVLVQRIDHGFGEYTFQLSGLNQISDNSFSTFYYTNGIDRIGPPYTISKRSPVVQDFRFNGVSEDSYTLAFKLPGIVEKSEFITIDLIGKNNELIRIGGSVIISSNEFKKDLYEARIPMELNRLVSQDTILNIQFVVKYYNKPLYSIGIEAFNQRILNEKIAELVSLTANKPRNRDEGKIKDILDDILKIGEAVGNTINDSEVKNALNNLHTGDSVSIKKTMEDIGKWALIAGKVILPIL